MDVMRCSFLFWCIRFVLCGGILFSVFFALNDPAQADPQLPVETNSLEYALIFHKMMNSPPDFDMWVDIYSKRKAAQLGPAGQENLKEGMKRSFQHDFAQLVPEDEILVMNVEAKMEAVPLNPHSPEDGHGLHLSLDQEFSFFVIEIPGYNLALVINDLDKALLHKLPYEEFRILERQAGIHDIGKQNKVFLSFTMKPDRIDSKGPIQIKDDYFWGLYADLIRMEIRDISDGRKIWQYIHMPEYDDRQNKLRSLYSRGLSDPASDAQDVEQLF
jgi:hypothetical protein